MKYGIDWSVAWNKSMFYHFGAIQWTSMAFGFHPIGCDFHQAINPRLSTFLMCYFSFLSFPPPPLPPLQKALYLHKSFLFSLDRDRGKTNVLYHCIRVLRMVANKLYRTIPKIVNKLA